MRTTQRDMNYTRTVSGRVNGAGAVTQGTGFTAAKTGTGQYTIRLQPRAAGVLSVVASLESGSQYIAVPAEIGSEGVFTIYVFNAASNTSAEVPFQFTATVLERR